MNRPRLLVLLVLLLAVSCAGTGPGEESAKGGTGNGNWSYAIGPHGEHCLIYREGAGYSITLGMSCDRVVWSQ